jgi:hypothetical protein
MKYEYEIYLIVLIQSIMIIIIGTDLFGWGNIGLNWLKIIVLVLWNISCSLCTGGMFLQRKKVK